jgi:ubiquinone/menaquinone biosynthesis C-methylase UbiE
VSPDRSGPSQTFFDLWSRLYDLAPVQRIVYRPVQDAVVKAIGHPGRILDIGCGTGLLTARLAIERPDAVVVGCDFSFGMLEQAAASRGAPAWWVQGDAMRLPFADGSFGAVACTESFHWYPDQGAALREFFRVLRPGGRLLVALVNPPVDALSRAGEVAARIAGQPAVWPSRRRMREMVEEAGFRLEQQRAVRRPPATLLLAAVLTTAVKN